ncbi:MAG: hypothetical protein LQ347_005259, partial [Umbilicaria vellea]
MQSDGPQKSAEPGGLGGLGGGRAPNLVAFLSDASTATNTTTKFATHVVPQVVSDQDLARDRTTDAIPGHRSSSVPFDSHDSQVPSSHPEVDVTTNLDSNTVSQVATEQDPTEKPASDAIIASNLGQPRSNSQHQRTPSSQLEYVVTIDKLTAESLPPGRIFRFGSSSTDDRQRSRPRSLPTNFTGFREGTSINNKAHATRASRPSMTLKNPLFRKPSNPFQYIIRNLLGDQVSKPGDKPGSSVVGDCVVSWKPSVVPQLFEFKYWFKQFKKKCVILVQDYRLRQESPVSFWPRVLAEHHVYNSQQKEAEQLVETARSKVVLEVIKEGKWKEKLAKMGEKEREEMVKLREEQEAQKKADQEATLHIVAQHALDERGGVEKYLQSDAAFLVELAELDQVDPEAVHRLSDLKKSGIALVENTTSKTGVSAVEIFDGELVNKSDQKRMRRHKLISTHKQNKTARETSEVGDAEPRKEHEPGVQADFARNNEENPDGGRALTWQDNADFQEKSEPSAVIPGTTLASIVTIDDYEDYEEDIDLTTLASSSKSGELPKPAKSGTAELTNQMPSGPGMKSQVFNPTQHSLSQRFFFDFDFQEPEGNIRDEYFSAEEDSITLSGDESPLSTTELSAKARGKLPAKRKGRRVKQPSPAKGLESLKEGKDKRNVVQEASTSPDAEPVFDTEDPQSDAPNAGDQVTTTNQDEAHAVTILQLKKEPSHAVLDGARGRGGNVRKERSDSVNFLRRRTLSRESSASASQPSTPPGQDSIAKLDSSVVEVAEEEMSGAQPHTAGRSELNIQAAENALATKDDKHYEETRRADGSTFQGVEVVNTQFSATEVKGPQSGSKKSKSKSKKARRNHKFQANLAQAVKEETLIVPELSNTAEHIQSTQKDELDATARYEQQHEDAKPAHTVRVAEPISTKLDRELLDSVKSTKKDKIGANDLHEQSHEDAQLPHTVGLSDPVGITLREELFDSVKSAEHPGTVEVAELISTTTSNKETLDDVTSAEHSATTEDLTVALGRQTSKHTRKLRKAKTKTQAPLASKSSSVKNGRPSPVPEADFSKDDGLADFSIHNNLLVIALTDPGLIAGGLTGPRMVQEGVMDDLSEDEMETTNRNSRHPRELAPYTPYADQKKWVYRNQNQRINMACLKEKYVLIDKPDTYLLGPSAETVVRRLPDCEGATAVVTAYATDGDVPLIEYDDVRNRFIIYPHAQPWKDLRNDALHPDFLPGHKLAEYQAYEYAGFSVWRHDRAQLKCALPRCTKMLEDYNPNVLICNGCGTKSHVRYCNRPHLLEDVENHWKICGATPIMEIIDGGTQPSRFYRRYPAIVEKHGFNSEQRHRQRANNIGATAAEYGLFTDSKILYYGVVFHNWYDRDRFNRCFNACMFDITQTQVLSFMFRTIRYSLRRDDAWSQDKKLVVIRQFKAEFNFDYEAHQIAGHDICDCEWFGEAWNVSRCTGACKRAQSLMGDAFRAKGIDQILTELEAKHWILRVWRRHRRGWPKNWEERMRGVGFPGVPKGQRSLEFRPAMGEG